MQDLEQAIRERAYHLWIADDCRDGNASSHWLTAQREVLASSLEAFGRVSVVAENSDAAHGTKSAPSNDKPAAKAKGRSRRRAA
jgi:hypothetical protein